MNHGHANLLANGEPHARRHAVEPGDCGAEIRLAVFSHRKERPSVAGVHVAERVQRVNARRDRGDVNRLYVLRPHVQVVIMPVMVMAVVTVVVMAMVMTVVVMAVMSMAVMMATMSAVTAAEGRHASG
jgi:hypothetical protein